MTPTVLLVEDNPATRKVVKFSLERAGYRLIEADRGHAALNLADGLRPDLILQDICLPDIDGYGLVKLLREKYGPEVPILAFSGFITKADESRIIGAGFDGLLEKPVDQARLIHTIRLFLPEMPTQVISRESRRILLVEDDPILRRLMSYRLAKKGWQVTTAENGETALAMAATEKPDVILSDVNMPLMDGFGLTMALKSNPGTSHIPVLLVTSIYVEPADRELALRAGAEDLLLREPNLAAVLQALSRTIGHSPAGQDLPLSPDSFKGLELEHHRRVQHQLDRQLAVNSGLAQRCTMLATELAVLSRITEAVVRSGDLYATMNEVLAMFFDAGGISVGVMYLLDPDGGWDARTIGGAPDWSQEDAGSFFGQPDYLGEIISQGSIVLVQGQEVDSRGATLLERTGCASAVIVPMSYGDKALGALMVLSRLRQFDDPDWHVFLKSVATQLTLAFALKDSIEASKESMSQAQEAKAQLQALLDNIPDIVIMVDTDGKIIYINRLLPGHEIGAVLGSNWLDYIPQDQRNELGEMFRQVKTTGDTLDYETTIAAPDNGGYIYSSTIGPVKRNGNIVGAVIIGRDVTMERQAKAQVMAADRMASVGLLAAGIAHEINNPLAAVFANLYLANLSVDSLGDGGNSAALAELRGELGEAQAASERVRQIVKDLRLFSRVEEADRRTRQDVTEVLESTIRMCGPEISRRARISRQFDSTPLVLADPGRLGQVFLNLLVNAAQAIPKGDPDSNEIAVATAVSSDGMVEVTIRDTGCGMPSHVIDRLFSPFFTTKPVGEGTGLGLSICHNLVTAMGGEIMVQSEVGKGSTFTVRLPPANQSGAGTSRRFVPIPSQSGQPAVVLVTNRDTGGIEFRDSLVGFETLVVAPGDAAVLTQLGAGKSCRLVLWDLVGAGPQELDQFRRMSEQFPWLTQKSVLLVGESPDSNLLVGTSRSGLLAVLKWPGEMDLLKSLVEKHMASGGKE